MTGINRHKTLAADEIADQPDTTQRQAMPRTIVYDGPELQRAMASATDPTQGRWAIAPLRRRKIRRNAEATLGAAMVAEPAPPPPPGATTRDGYLARIAKYVPAEMITLTTLGFGAFAPTGTTAWLWVAGGAILNMIYLLGASINGPETQRPRWFFYLLSGPAYILWAAATIDAVGVTAGIGGANSDSKKAFILATAAFLIPGLDILLEHLDRNWWGASPPASLSKTVTVDSPSASKEADGQSAADAKKKAAGRGAAAPLIEGTRRPPTSAAALGTSPSRPS